MAETIDGNAGDEPHEPQEILGVDWASVLTIGVIGGLLMAMVTMVVEWTIGDGFWAPLVYISAVLLRDLQDVVGEPGFIAGPVLLGAVLHFLTAIVLTSAFVQLAPRRWQEASTLVLVGMLFGLLVYLVAWYVVLPLVNPVMLQLNGWGFALGHVAWGAAAGYAADAGVTTRREARAATAS